jgi:hypothetical protein
MSGTGAYGRSDTLPPIGESLNGPDAGNTVRLIYERRHAIINQLASPLRIAKACRRIVTWGEDTDVPNDCKTLVNKIRIACETQVANHLKEPAKVTIEGVESGEYASYYWCGPPEAAMELQQPVGVTDEMGQPVADEMDPTQQAVAMAPMIDPLYLGAVMPDGTVQPPLPLPTPLVKQLQAMAQADMIDPQFICRLDDEYTAKTIQKKFDEDWRTAKAEKWMRSRVWANVIEGWQLPFYEFDQRTKKHLLHRNSIEQTYIDQSVEDIDDATEAGIDLYMDLEEALSLYPNQRDAILASNAANQGSMVAPATAGKVPVQFSGQFQRPMIRKIVWWIRNRPVGVAVAVAKGLVEQREVLDAPATPMVDSVQPVAPESQHDVGALGVDDLRTPDTQAGSVGPSEATDGQSTNPVRLAYFLPGTNTEVIPGSPDWPTGIHQLSIIADELVEDDLNALPDIQLLHMRNNLVIGRPWGVGEPFSSKKLQDAYSGITTDAVQHAHACAFPAVVMHEAIKQSMEREFGSAFLKPNQIIGRPASTYGANMPVSVIEKIDPPAFPTSSIQIREMIGEDFNAVSGRPDVLAGNTPTPTASGKMVAQLQAAAVEPLNFKAQEIAYMAEKLADLMLFCILNFVSRAEIAKTVSVPEPLLELVLQRAKSRPPNIRVVISTGAGSVIERKRAQYLQLGQMVDPMDGTPYASGRTVREVQSLDANMEERRNQQAARQRALVLAPMQNAGQDEEGGEQGQEKQESGNGNGRFH